jgi:NADH:ubiquinone oxidoreductase subunit 6 (subunit J)
MKKALFLTLITLLGISVIGTNELMAQDAAPAAEGGSGMIDIGLYIAYGMVILAALGAIVLPLVRSAGDPKALIKSGLGVVAILVVFFIAYAISGNEVNPLYTQFDVDAGDSKLIGGVIITSYLLIFIAILGIIYTEVSNIVR